MNKKIIAVALIFIIANVFSCGSKQADNKLSDNNLIKEIDEHSQIVLIPPEPTRAERAMKAVFAAYPDRIESVEFKNEDWAVLMKGVWYYYAEGRILPENRVEYASSYRPFQFYQYPAELPPWTSPTTEEIERYRSWTTNRRQNTTRRPSYFLDALWQASNRAETEGRLVRVTFLGRRTRIHYAIQEKLVNIETQIRDIAKTDSAVQTWISSIGTLEGYGWRNVADTQSRSYHSYGLALDLLPRSMGGRQTYWLWTSQHREDWWNVSYRERYHPPAAVIKTFEDHGFVWGGKWPLFDTMHFEYRPEILIFNGLF
jgi:hypothetical protein